MARFEFDIRDFLFFSADAVERYAIDALEAAAPIVEKEMKRQLMQFDRTGQLSASVKSKVVHRKKAHEHRLVVRPTGKSKSLITDNGKLYVRKDPQRNMEKLASIEFGKSGQRATPIIQKIVDATTNDVIDVMEKVWIEKTKEEFNK